jgi:hypothetical protein
MTSAQQAQLATQAALNQMQAGGVAPGTSYATAVAAITSQQQFIINSFKGQIYISNQLDVQDTPVYDTITYAPSATINTTNSQFFSNVGALSGKTLAQTNMAQTQKLDAPEAFACFAIRLAFSEDILRSDVQTLLNSWAYTMTLGQKWYQRANIRHFAAGWGLFGTTTKTSESIYTNGIPSMQAMHGLAVKLVIANQMSFSAELDGSAGQTLSASGNGLIMVNELVGLYARGVQ